MASAFVPTGKRKSGMAYGEKVAKKPDGGGRGKIEKLRSEMRGGKFN